jgi:gliding motility-associated-like protein
LCPGDTFQFYDLQITQPDTFAFVDGMFHHIAVVFDGTTYSVINDTIVENQLPYTFNGQTFYDDSDTIAIVLPRANSHGCDSVILYTLSVYRNQLTLLDTVVCPYDVPLVWNGVLFTDDHRDTVLVTTTRGADSVIVMNLHVSRDLKARIHASRQYVNYDTRCDIWLSDRSSGSTTRVWYLPDATDTRNLFQYCYPLDNDSIIVQLVAESEIGCYDTTEAVLFFEEPSLFAPNVFTPSQTTNNTFQIHCQRVATLSVDIFDRRGALVYHWDGTEGYWDGNVDGRPMPQSTYVWHAVYTTYVNPNERNTLTGTVTLVR